MVAQDGARGALSRPHQSDVHSPWRLTKLVKETTGSTIHKLILALAIRIGTTCSGLRVSVVIDCVLDLASILKLASSYPQKLEFKCLLLLLTNLCESVEGKGDVSHAHVRNTYSDAAVSYSETLSLHVMLSSSRRGLELVCSDGSCLVVVVPQIRYMKVLRTVGEMEPPLLTGYLFFVIAQMAVELFDYTFRSEFF
ncbi:hypothetical protein ACOSQ3_003859 [Xanthoceras sorbifolium]